MKALGSEHCQLTFLSLEFNTINDEGAVILSNALEKENCKLTVLNLGFCPITGARDWGEVVDDKMQLVIRRSKNCGAGCLEIWLDKKFHHIRAFRLGGLRGLELAVKGIT